MQQRPSLAGILEMVAAMSISGTLGWFVALGGLPPPQTVFYRCLFGAMALGLVCWRMGFLALRPTRAQLLWALAGGVAIVLNWVMIFAAYDRASISVATIVYQVQPFLLLIFGALFLREPLHLWQIGWLGVAFIGFIVISVLKPGFTAVSGQYALGIALSLGAAALYAVATLIVRRLKGVPPHLIAFIQVCVGTLLLAPFAAPVPPLALSLSWAALVSLGLIHTALMYILLYGAIQKLPLASTASLTFIYPLVALVIDILVFGQHFTPLQSLGIALVLLAAAGVNLGWRLGLPRSASAR